MNTKNQITEPEQSVSPLFNRHLVTSSKNMAQAFQDEHDRIIDTCHALRDMDQDFFHKHFRVAPPEHTQNNGGANPGYEMNLAGFLVLANMMEDTHYGEYLREIQAVCIDLDIILRGPLKTVRELSWEVPLEDMAETIKANLAPLLGTNLTDQQQRRRDFAFALIDRLNPDVEPEPSRAI